MILLLVHIHVKPESVDGFKAASTANARQSVQEPGIARFDFIQQIDDPTRFVLIEAYRSAEAVAAHKETPHYAAWRDAVVDMMASPRQGVKHTSIWPADEGW